MNGPRIHGEETPEGRLAAVAVTLAKRLREELGRVPDYADFRDEFRIYIRHELTLARIDEARRGGHFDRMKELVEELSKVKLK